MKKLIGLMLGLLVTVNAFATRLVDLNFESGVIPSNCAEWGTSWDSGIFTPASWNYQPALSGQTSVGFGAAPLAAGTFFRYAQAADTVYATFLFNPASFNSGSIEVLDLYDGPLNGPGNGDEILQVYLGGSHQLILSMGNGANRTVSAPLTAGQTVRIWVRYTKGTTTGTAIGTLAWSLPNDPEPLSGSQFNTITWGQYTTPSTRALFGPVYGSAVFVYDDVIFDTQPIKFDLEARVTQLEARMSTLEARVSACGCP